MKRASFILLLFILIQLPVFAQEYVLTSPDKAVRVACQVREDGTLWYSASVDGKMLLSNSRLGYQVVNRKNLQDGFRVAVVERDTVDETWTQIWGENKTNRNHYCEMRLRLENDDNVELAIVFRAFDDGFAFRYEGEVKGADSILIADELTEFNFGDDGDSWSIPASFDSYEFLYRKMPLSNLIHANTPMTFRLDNGLYGSVHEAALTDYPEMTLMRKDALSFRAELASWPDGVKARYAGGRFSSPWRTVQVGRQAVDLINSALILNLNEPCALQGDLNWIKPMKYVGIWWGMHLGIQTWTMDERHGATTDHAKRCIDFAADNKVDAVVFEGWNEGWETWGGRQHFDFTKPYADFNVDEILAYARERNVEVICHHETGANIPNYERQLERAYQWLDSLGVQAVKTGYSGDLPDGHCHHGQYNVRHYRDVVLTAAKHHCVLDVHEPIKPTGIRRTYPNMMTQEGVRGMEWNAWSEGNPPSHHEILPFTRMLAGPLDYTPGTFDILFKKVRNASERQLWNGNTSGDNRVWTTICKQLANWVILYSPLQMASDMVENYEGHPCFQFFRDYNADCDWSRALQGEIGEYVVVVRRAGDTFFLGATTNEQPRRLMVPLDFLPEGVHFTATIYKDALDADWKFNPTAYEIEVRKHLSREAVLEMVLSQGGGQAVVMSVEMSEEN